MTFVEQIEDSNTVPGHPLLTELLFPLGLRYHCLHHLLPSLPYHSLGTAHRRLMAQLPEDSPYRGTIRGSFLEAAREVWRGARGEQGLSATQPSAGKDRAPEPSTGPMAPSP